jgi:ATP-binding protein involved in chromosome partitioning
MRSARNEGIPLLGIIENMSGYRCPGCDEVRPLFDGTAGRDLAGVFGLSMWGTVPFSPAADPTLAPSLPDPIVSRFLESLS